MCFGDVRQKMKTTEKFTYDVEVIFKEYYAPLCLFASRFLQPGCDPEDVVQEVFASFVEKKQSFKTCQHLQNSLYLSVRNACISFLRKHNSRNRYLNELHLGEDQTLEQAIITTEVYRELAESIDTLPPECRKIFEMSYIQGMDNDKVARELSLSINTVKSQKARGKKLLKEKLKDLYPLFLIFFGIDTLM